MTNLTDLKTIKIPTGLKISNMDDCISSMLRDVLKDASMNTTILECDAFPFALGRDFAVFPRKEDAANVLKILKVFPILLKICDDCIEVNTKLALLMQISNNSDVDFETELLSSIKLANKKINDMLKND